MTSAKQEQLYKVQWILNPDDPSLAGLYGTTTHFGSSPAAAAIASARIVSRDAKERVGRAQMFILSVSGDDSRENLLSSGDLQTALVRFDEAFPFELVYRPLC